VFRLEPRRTKRTTCTDTEGLLLVAIVVSVQRGGVIRRVRIRRSRTNARLVDNGQISFDQNFDCDFHDRTSATRQRAKVCGEVPGGTNSGRDQDALGSGGTDETNAGREWIANHCVASKVWSGILNGNCVAERRAGILNRTQTDGKIGGPQHDRDSKAAGSGIAYGIYAIAVNSRC
jgi:hypothetical protein